MMECAISKNMNEIKEIYYQNNSKLGSFGGYCLLADLFKYSCDTMFIELLDTLYEINDKMDDAICLDCQPSIFNKSILTNNINFYNILISHRGPLFVLQTKLEEITQFTVIHRCKFMPILLLLSKDNIIYNIEFIKEDIIFNFFTNIMRVDDISNDNEHIYIEYLEDNFDMSSIRRIPINIKDKEYIDFLYTLTQYSIHT